MSDLIPNGRRVALKGDLTYQRVDEICRELLTLARHEGDLTLDLATLQGCDSSGVALLAACNEVKQRQQDRLFLAHVPANLLSLFRVYGLDGAFQNA